jgi:hypothetical protein
MKYFLITDTEQGEGEIVYDLAFILTDSKGKPLESVSGILRPLPTADKYWPPHKVAKYDSAHLWADSQWESLRSILDVNPILVGFNIMFDKLPIVSDRDIPIDIREDIYNLEFLDLRLAALAALGIQANYPSQVTGRTDRGSVRSRLSDFILWKLPNSGKQQHTAIADCAQAAELLRLVLRQKRRLPYGIESNAAFCNWGRS